MSVLSRWENFKLISVSSSSIFVLEVKVKSHSNEVGDDIVYIFIVLKVLLIERSIISPFDIIFSFSLVLRIFSLLFNNFISYTEVFLLSMIIVSSFGNSSFEVNSNIFPSFKDSDSSLYKVTGWFL